MSIPASTDTVRLFVALLKRDIFAQPDQEITGDLLPAVVDLATRYDCHAVNSFFIMLLLPSSDFVAPWTLFLVASRLDLVWLARRAIKRFTTKDYDWTGLGEDDDRIFKSQIDGRYLVALTRSALACWAGQHVVPYQHVYIRPIIIPRSELRRDPVYGDVECTPPPVHGTTMASLSFSAERLADAFTVAPAPRTAEEPAGSQRVDQVTQTIKLFSKDGEGVDVELHHLQASR